MFMSLVFDASPFEPYSDDWRQDGRPWLAEQFCNVSQFLRKLRVQMRFGELTRAPLHLLRLNILGEIAKCDWLARTPDPWDADISKSIRDRHASLQALKDAIDVRALLFETIPNVDTADLRVYRENSSFEREMIITGCVQRNDHSARNIHSIAMRAKILGFRFNLDGDILSAIPAEDQNRIVD
jgi:hypothetical protein